jgi:hypothetical protein
MPRQQCICKAPVPDARESQGNKSAQRDGGMKRGYQDDCDCIYCRGIRRDREQDRKASEEKRNE